MLTKGRFDQRHINFLENKTFNASAIHFFFSSASIFLSSSYMTAAQPNAPPHLDPPNGSARDRRWVFTLNFNAIDRAAGINDILNGLRPELYRGCWQVERAPTTGHYHYQGYLEFTNKKSFNQLRAFFSNHGFHPYLAFARGTAAENLTYCNDGNKRAAGFDAVSYGDFATVAGTRSDLNAAVETARTGSISDLWREHTRAMVLHHRGLLLAQQFFSAAAGRQRTWYTTIHWCYGPTGVGKTRWLLLQIAGRPCFFMPRPNSRNIYFDSYSGQDCMALDDYDGFLPYAFLVGVLVNNVPALLPARGRDVPCLIKHLYVTSERSPSSYYPNDDTSSLTRRFHEPDNALIHQLVPFPEVAAYRAQNNQAPAPPNIIQPPQPVVLVPATPPSSNSLESIDSSMPSSL